jgi:pilus assembly protein TadC
VVATMLCFAAVWCWSDRHARVALRRLTPDGTVVRATPLAERWWVRTLACVVGAGMVGSLVGGTVLLVLGAIAGAGVSWWVGTLEPAALAKERESIARDLPMAAELLAACALVGAPIDHALSVVADALGGPLAERLRSVVVRLELGADPAGEWRRLETDPELATLARTLVRAIESGAPPADGLSRLATDRRRDRRGVLLGRARAVGVKSAGPLAACFLPAFMLVGVVPIVVGVFSQLAL